MFALVFGLHFHVRGRHAVLPDFFGRDFPAGDIEAAQLFAQVLKREASVGQSAERHVAADSAKAIKIREFHERYSNALILSAGQKRGKKNPPKRRKKIFQRFFLKSKTSGCPKNFPDFPSVAFIFFPTHSRAISLP